VLCSSKANRHARPALCSVDYRFERAPHPPAFLTLLQGRSSITRRRGRAGLSPRGQQVVLGRLPDGGVHVEVDCLPADDSVGVHSGVLGTDQNLDWMRVKADRMTSQFGRAFFPSVCARKRNEEGGSTRFKPVPGLRSERRGAPLNMV
jgi:hypothetical protein